MTCAADMSIRPAAPAELPAIAHVADRDDRRRQEPQGQSDAKAHARPAKEQTPPQASQTPHADEAGQGSTIDVMA